MAQPADKLNLPGSPLPPADVVPTRSLRGDSAIHELQMPVPNQSSVTSRLCDPKGPGAEGALISTKLSIARVYRVARERTSDSFARVMSASHDVTRRAWNRAEQLKRERPLQLLAVVSGSAFALGIAARIWRSHHHA